MADSKYLIVPFTRGTGIEILEVGESKTYPHFLTVHVEGSGTLDSAEGVEVPDIAHVSDISDSSLDFAYTAQGWLDFHDIWRTLKTGGYLVLDYGDQNQSRKQSRLIECMKAVGGWECVTREGILVFQKRDDQRRRFTPPRKGKTACIVRYGGFGDMLQSANILPELKRHGWHVTMMTTPKGQDILKHDPHIDTWFIQDTDQVPNHELTQYWAVQAKRFTKFINLSESVEGTFLAMPGRANHAWPDDVRRKYMGVNYLEFTAELAGVPYKSDTKFYPSDDEKTKAVEYLNNKTPDSFVILWVLSGSSIHKFYPHQDTVIARILLEMPDAKIIFSGDYPCKLLESGWEKESRIQCESGNLSIRDTLTLAQRVDMVIGPETGVLNAVAFEPPAKIIMLSHSSVENLTKHWINTDVMEPENTPCSPCHRLHYGRAFCPEDSATGAAMCQANIHPDKVFTALKRSYDAWKAKQ